MKQKWLLFTGLILLALGIILKITTQLIILSVLLIIIGAFFKLYYIVRTSIKCGYKPGYELLFLVAGLTIIFIGKYLTNQDIALSIWYFLIPAVCFKIVFVVLFMFKLKRLSSRT